MKECVINSSLREFLAGAFIIPFEPQAQHNAGSSSTWKISVDLLFIQV